MTLKQHAGHWPYTDLGTGMHTTWCYDEIQKHLKLDKMKTKTFSFQGIQQMS